MSDYYILDGTTPVPATYRAYIRWRIKNPMHRRIALDTVGDLEVSTVFLGLNHAYTREHPPVLFETMVFRGDESTGEQERYCTWAEAEAGHREMVERLEKVEGR